MQPRWHVRWRWPLSGGLVLALALSLSAQTGAALGETPSPDPAEAAGPATQVLTLVTGDQVVVEKGSGGGQAISIDPAVRDGAQPSFETIEAGEHVYVIPSDAASLVPDVLDRELFNVTRLADYGYTTGIPVIATHDERSGIRQPDTTGMAVTTTLPSINATAATVEDDGRWWRAVQSEASGRGDNPGEHQAMAETGPLSGVEKIWLDGQVEVALDVSVPQIGAPEAWDAGFDGAGVTVAVLDSGVDADHPDLADVVVAEADFTGAGTASDGYGHGTHVAGIIAGSGAASGGTYVGVAPGAELLNGKVLDDRGSGRESWIIDGMEWAAAEQDADVINMSLGTRGRASDGTDPMSQAVNQLTEAHDVLFVIAAGNDGPADTTVGSPGAADAALTVGAVDSRDQLASFSGRGPRLGDWAIKPDVTAPGVDIVAARAAGTALGEPVDDNYTRLSGTSMATPHVAGTAAIVLQATPDLAPGELKAVLATIGLPHDELDVHQQGGGRIDVPAALGATVLAAPAPLDLGYFRFPQDDAERVDKEITYTNRTDEPITLDLSLDVESRDGEAPSEAMLSVEPASLAVEPGATATATVTVDVNEGAFGLYGGYLIAHDDGAVVTRTPVGFYKEPERYMLTIQGIARDGRPAAGISDVDVIDVHDWRAFTEFGMRFRDFPNGEVTVQVAPGTYAVAGFIFTYDGPTTWSQERVMVVEPEVEVTEDTTVVLDARGANPVTIDTPAHETGPLEQVTMAYRRGDAQGGFFGRIFNSPPQPQYAVETQPVTVGAFEFHTRWRLGAPDLALSVVEPVDQQLSVREMAGSPQVDGEFFLPLVDAGLGRPEDYEGLDVDGAVVLTRRDGPSPYAQKEAAAAAAGAAALVIANNVPGNFTAGVGDAAQIPAMSLSMEQGDELRALLGQGEVMLRLLGHPDTPFIYDLVLPHSGHIPADLHFTADSDKLARLDSRYHGTPGQTLGEHRHFYRPGPWYGASFAFVYDVAAGAQRDEYVVAGDTEYQESVRVAAPESQLIGPLTSYDPGEEHVRRWLAGPLRPGFFGGRTDQREATVTYREQDELVVDIREWVDNDGNAGALEPGADSSAFRLYQDGELIAESARPLGSFPVSPEPASLRLEVDVARDAPWWLTSTQTRTAWTIQSDGTTDAAEVLPLLVVDYDADLDLFNTAPHPSERHGRHTAELQVRHQPGAHGPPIAGARAWVSYDDGDTWRARPTRRLGDGRFQVILDVRDPDDSTGFVSLRVEAWDADNNRIEQEITRAWRISPR